MYSFFMITDPITTPNAKAMRMAWAVLIAVLTFIATQFFYIQGAAFWVLFFASPLTPFLDRLMKARLYKWNEAKENVAIKYRTSILQPRLQQ
jgi:Na+-translocating ferredoxin:NAD+ oxidoreductase RnfD subunit